MSAKKLMLSVFSLILLQMCGRTKNSVVVRVAATKLLGEGLNGKNKGRGTTELAEN